MAKTLRSPAQKLLIEAVKSARKAAGLSQEDVAVRLGRPQSFIAKIETGERRLDVIEFVALANVIGLDAEHLFRDLAGQVDVIELGRISKKN